MHAILDNPDMCVLKVAQPRYGLRKYVHGAEKASNVVSMHIHQSALLLRVNKPNYRDKSSGQKEGRAPESHLAAQTLVGNWKNNSELYVQGSDRPKERSMLGSP